MSYRYILACFTKEPRLLCAARAVRERGWSIHEIYSPYPVHGVDQLIGHRKSRLAVVGFCAGCAGLVLALSFQYWAMSFSWDMVVGGKPFNSWPAYVPVIFELTILFAGVSTVAALFIRSRLWPGRNRPMIPEATDNLFVLVLREEDASIDLEAARELFDGLGAVTVREANTLALDEGKEKNKRKFSSLLLSNSKLGWAICILAPVVLISLLQALGRDFAQPNLSWPIQMADDPAYGAFEANPFLAGGQTMQPPVAGTVPRGYQPFHSDTTEASRLRAGRELTNPFDASEPHLSRGKAVFETFCLVCHGSTGAGDGPIIPKYPNPTAFNTELSMNRTDGEMFHIIAVGMKNMPSYASLVNQADRWKAILHIRELQKQRQ